MNEMNPLYRLWDCPVPHCLEDITGYLVDIQTARSCAQYFFGIRSDPDDMIVPQALVIAAVIQYCRCFTTGIRQRLDIDSLTTASSDEVTLHHRIQEVRNKHVAHPVNQQEQYSLHLILNQDSTASNLILGMSSLEVTSFPLKSDELSMMISLCEKWIEFLIKKKKEEVLRLKPYVDQLSREEILALQIAEPQPNDNLQARRKQGHYK
jgi:hypothetical protein